MGDLVRCLRLWSCALLVAIATGTLVLIAGPAVAAPPVACGDTVTIDTTLHADLIDCPNGGIVVGADNITIDLNGHTIDGDGVPSQCPDRNCDIGVDNVAGHDGVAIVGGTIRQFGIGVLATGGDDNAVRDVTVADSAEFGVIIGDSTGTVIDKNSLSDNGTTALVLFESRDALISRNMMTGSHGYSMALFAIDHSRIERNRIDRNDHGILLAAGSSHNILEANAVSHSGGSAIDVVDGASANRVERNRLTDNGDGIIVGGHDNVFSGNLVTGTGTFGFPFTGGFGIFVDGGDRNSLRQNKVTGGRGPAILLARLEAPDAAENNVVSLNTVNSKVHDGILASDGSSGTVIEANVAIGNGDEGIDIDVPGATLTRNIANHNDDLGIEAAPGVTDGGGNHAAGNGNPAECINVAC